MDVLRKCIAQYKECKRLLEIESKKDPETDPYRSKYKAKSLLLEAKDLVNEHLKNLDTTDKEFHLYKVALSALTGQIGIVYLETEEFSKAEEYFMDCLASISDHLHPDYIIVSIHVRNSLGYLWSHRSQSDESVKWLEEAEKLYKDFKNSKENVAQEFCNILDDEKSDDGEKELETAHTSTLFYLAQVYGALKELLKSAVYCHATLKRQLMYKKYDPMNWGLSSATLSQVFTERMLFKQARHHLAAASYVLDIYEESLKDLQDSQEEIDAKREQLRYTSADVSRCWAKYGIFLLEHSKNKLSDAAQKSPEEKTEDFESLWFDGFDFSTYENQIADSEVVSIEGAREIFLVTQKHLNKAKEYYTLEDRASDHVQIVLDHSQLFRHLTAFESDKTRQFKMMKKRVDMLELVLKELNPKYYLDLCRQLWFELGDTYYDMMQVKFQKMEGSEVPAAQALMKINGLVETSIAHFNHFLDSLKDEKSKELPETLPEELLESALVALFYLGRLYYKFVTQDKKKQMENTKKAYECFKRLVDFCEKNENAKSILGEGLNISRNMMNLLHLKILRL